MCTILLRDETEDARKMSAREAQQCVDRLMEYDHKLSTPFTGNELKKLLEFGYIEERACVFTDAEKELLAEFGWKEESELAGSHIASIYSEKLPDAENIDNVRHALKAQVIDAPDFSDIHRTSLFSGNWNKSGHVFVWLDNCNYCESKYKGFYYVRYQLSMQDGWSTAYAFPELIVEKKKLRPDQIEYMERKRQKTFAAARYANEQEERNSEKE